MNLNENHILELVFLALVVVLSIAFVRLMQPFILSAFVAVVLANVFRRPYRALRKKLKRRGLAAGIATLMVLVVVAVPVSIVVMLVSSEVAELVSLIQNDWGQIRSMIALDEASRWLAQTPLGQVLFAEGIDQADIELAVRNAASNAGDVLLRITQNGFANLAAALFNFFIVLLLVFFLFIEGSGWMRRAYATIPISNQTLDEIVAETFATTSATLVSTLLIGVMEGALAALLFVSFGLPSPALWGTITVVLSMIPLVGSNLIIIPAGSLTLLSGRIAAGIVIVLVGAVGVAITQNVIKPKLLGDRSGLNPALALLATLGGIAWLGLIGFLVGPVLASLFIVVWRQFAARYQSMLERKNGATSAD